MAVLIAAHRTGSTVSGNCLAKMRFSFRKNSTHNQLRLLVAIRYELADLGLSPLITLCHSLPTARNDNYPVTLSLPKGQGGTPHFNIFNILLCALRLDVSTALNMTGVVSY